MKGGVKKMEIICECCGKKVPYEMTFWCPDCQKVHCYSCMGLKPELRKDKRIKNNL